MLRSTTCGAGKLGVCLITLLFIPAQRYQAPHKASMRTGGVLENSTLFSAHVSLLLGHETKKKNQHKTIPVPTSATVTRCAQEGTVSEDGDCEATVVLKSSASSRDKGANLWCPRFPKATEVGWWLVLGTDAGELLAFKKVSAEFVICSLLTLMDVFTVHEISEDVRCNAAAR